MISLIQLLMFWLIFDIPYLLYRIFLLFHHAKKIKLMNYPLVSIIIPAYNEELTIEKTLISCLHQTYNNLEIIVVNDGSKDKTVKIVKDFKKEHLAELETRGIDLTLISQENKGKAKALNFGKESSKGEFLVTIDADSFLSNKAVENILGYFSSDEIGAVAGNIVALSHRKILGYMQKIEYELGIYFLRESQSGLGDVMVTPGAFSAYRKKAVKKFEEGTLTEDFDSSVRILERKYKIVLAPNAICYTQVPLNIPDLIKQRVRWQQGGLEVFSKHLFHPKRLSVTIEWLFLFFFGFYGLFSKLLAFLIIPVLLLLGFNVIYGLLIFAGYTLFVHSFQFFIVNIKSKDKKAVFATPLFIVYYYTIVLYSILIAQIMVFKGGVKWEKIKRYHT